LAQEAKRSPLLSRFPVNVIANGLDTSIFRPIDRRIARAALSLPEKARVVLFVAESASNRRKGYQQLLRALDTLVDHPNLMLLTLGADVGLKAHGLPCRQLGHITDDGLLALAYSAADVFALPSIQDNLPNTALEALACGTPIVAFSTGGIPDVVRTGETGFLVPLDDFHGFAAALAAILGESTLQRQLSMNARRIAVKEYEQHVMAQNYLALYRAMVASASNQPQSP
jgi:glycosyltransferase involved in cell wall biosynthesis